MKSAVHDPTLDRPLPHSADTERATLGAVIPDNGLINRAIEMLRPGDFFDLLSLRG